GTQANQNKNADESLKYAIGMANGDGLNTITRLFNSFNAHGLSNMGFYLARSEVAPVRVHESMFEVALINETDHLAKAMRLAFCLAGRRALGLEAWHTAFPGHAAALLSPDAGTREKSLRYWKGVADDWKQILETKFPTAMPLIKRNFCNTPIFHDFIEQLTSTNFQALTTSLDQNLRVGFSITQTLVVENFFKAARTAESRCQDNKQLSWLRRWITPIQRKIDTSTFQYTSVDFRAQVLQGSQLAAKSLPRSFFVPKKSNLSVDYNAMVSEKKTAPFTTWNAQSQKFQIPDLALLRRCAVKNCWGDLHLFWMSQWCLPMTVFKDTVADEWVISLSTHAQSAVLAVPVQQMVFNGVTYFTLPYKLTTDNLKWVIVLDLDSLGYEVEWVGPLYREKHKLPDNFPLMCGKADGDPKSLCEILALNCFGNLKITWLRKFASHFKLETPRTASLWDTLLDLMKFVLPTATDDDLLAIMSKRLPPDTDSAINWDACAVDDVIETGDLDEVNKASEKEKKHKDATATYQVAFKTLRAAVLQKRATAAAQEKKAEPKASKRARVTAASASASSSSRADRKPMPPLAVEHLTLEHAREWLPDQNFTLYKDFPNGRWLLTEGRYFRVSRSFLKHGEVGAFATCAKKAYEHRKLPVPASIGSLATE
ncbi:unnamed protein product, partial [Prorocentrum cordatum]